MRTFIPTIRDQLRGNSVALISLFIAIFGLGYNTWRNERTEEQRSIRLASFRVIENLGEIQEIVDARYYYLPFEKEGSAEAELRLRGFGRVAMSRDLMNLMPPPAPTVGQELHSAWIKHFNALDDVDSNGHHTAQGQQAEEALRNALNFSRVTVIDVLKKLD